MKRIGLIAVILLLSVIATSCGKEESNIDKTQITGKWKKADNSYFEVYYSDGTGKEWTPAEDVFEDEASWFTWEFDKGTDDKFIKLYEMEIGGTVPQYCNILELNSTTFKYNNEGFRATYNLVRAE